MFTVHGVAPKKKDIHFKIKVTLRLIKKVVFEK